MKSPYEMLTNELARLREELDSVNRRIEVEETRSAAFIESLHRQRGAIQVMIDRFEITLGTLGMTK